MNSEEVFLKWKVNLFTFACTDSEESDQEPFKNDFSDQEVGIHIFLKDNSFLKFSITLAKFSFYLEFLEEIELENSGKIIQYPLSVRCADLT